MHQMWIRKQELLRQGKSVFPGWNPGESQGSKNTDGSFAFSETQAVLDDIAHSQNAHITSGARPKDSSYANQSQSTSMKNWKVTADSDDDDYDDGFNDDLELFCEGYDYEEPYEPPATSEPYQLSSNFLGNETDTDWGNWVPQPDPPPPPSFHNRPPSKVQDSSLYSPPSAAASADCIDFQRQIVGKAGVPIQVEALNEGIFANVDIFFVCATCGKVFWEGKHFERILTQFEEVIVGIQN